MAETLRGPSMLAIVGRDRTGSDLWRVLQPITALERRGYPCGWDFRDTALLGAIAPQYDGYLLARVSWAPEHRRVADAWFASVKRAGKVVVFDCDDDLFTAAETHRRMELDWTDGKSFARLESERFERIWAMQQCHGVTVSTQRLATIVRSYTTAPVVVVPNAIDLPWFRTIVSAETRKIPGPTIGWAGGRRHDRDVEPMARAWARIAARYPSVTFVVQGHQPSIIRETLPAARLAALPWMPIERYPAGLAQVDIACCALADVPFNRAKSAIKCLEAAAAGSAVVASPLLYGDVVEHGRSGFLAESVDDWEAALARLVESPSTRSMLARRLLRTVERTCSLAENIRRWPAAWATIAESARSDRGILKLA